MSTLIDFWITLPSYLWRRGRQLSVFSTASFELFGETFARIKTYFVSRMFWGRGGLYKNAFHFLVLMLTVTGLLFGLVSRIVFAHSTQDALAFADVQGASNDLLQQGSGIQTVLAIDPLSPAIEIRQHVVAPGQTLEDIAASYGINVDTIRWANSDIISPFTNAVEVGWKLKIPEIDGVLYRVRNGQSLDDIVKITGGNRIDIIELNSLVPPSYPVAGGQQLFVPYGSLDQSEVVVAGIPTGIFTNPLSHPDCAGYSYSRGYTGYHNGVDLARYPGCPIRAVATGKVIFAGWSGLAGFNVQIDHGSGIVTHYYHGSGEFWVKQGDRVQQGQEIMMMGTSGNSTGVHLHLSLFKNNISVNPAPFVPY